MPMISLVALARLTLGGVEAGKQPVLQGFGFAFHRSGRDHLGPSALRTRATLKPHPEEGCKSVYRRLRAIVSGRQFGDGLRPPTTRAGFHLWWSSTRRAGLTACLLRSKSARYRAPAYCLRWTGFGVNDFGTVPIRSAGTGTLRRACMPVSL